MHVGKTILILGLILCLPYVAFAQEDVVNKETKVYVIPLREDVDRYLGVFLGRSLEAAKRSEAELVILEINTFGGRVDTALEIASKIGSANWAKTVAYVPSDSNGQGVSWSAGALIAFSCSEIWMAPGTSMGAAAPVYQSAEGTKPAEEKTVSALRGQITALAEKNNYPLSVALAMVDEDIILREVILNGEPAVLTDSEIDAIKNQDGNLVIGKTVSDAGKLLTLTAGQMEKYAVSQGSVSTLDELVQSLGYRLEDVFIVEKSPSDTIITLLSSSALTSILLLVALVALYLEITSPGFGIPGAIALMCFGLIFATSSLMGNLSPQELLLLLAGILLLLLEIFVIPGFGIAGVAGILMIIISLSLSLQNFFLPQFSWQWEITGRNLRTVGIGILGSILGIGTIMISFPRTSLFNRLVLKDPNNPEYGDQVEKNHQRKDGESSIKKPDNSSFEEMIQVYKIGYVATDLRPVGKIVVDGHKIVAETEGEYCVKGTQVTIVRIEGKKVVVAAKGE